MCQHREARHRHDAEPTPLGVQRHAESWGACSQQRSNTVTKQQYRSLQRLGDASLSRNQVHRIGKQVALKATVLSDHVKHDFAAGNGDQQSGDEAGRAALETKVLYFRDNNLARTTNLISEV